MNLIWLYTLAVSITSVATADVDLPGLDIQSLGGNLGLLGSFSAISLYRNNNQSSFLSEAADDSASSKNTTAASVNNIFLHDTDNNAVQNLGSVDGTLQSLHALSGGNVLLAGDFSKFTPSSSSSSSSSASSNKNFVNRAASSNSSSSPLISSPVIYNISSGESTAIFNASSQVTGTVSTVLVDNDLIYLGGDFEFNNTFGVAIYNTTSNQLSSTPFQGFGKNAAVYTIVKILDDASGSDDAAADANTGSILFGGSFNTLGLKQLLTHNVTNTGSNSSNNTNTSLITAEQIVSLKHGTFTSVQGDSATPENTLICPETSQGWSVQANIGGEWKVELADEQKGLTPTKVRLYLPESGDNGVKLFRIYSYPNNGIMNLSYVDPQTNELAFCDAWCPLASFTQLSNITKSNMKNADTISFDDTTFVDESDGSFSTYYDSSTKTKTLGYASNYQEFSFEDELGISSVGLTVLDWYGDQGTLQGFELYSNSIIVYGDNSLNEPNCASIEDSSNLSELNGGDWQSVLDVATSGASPALNDTNYLVTTVGGGGDNGAFDNVSVTFFPNISYSGDYSILLYTPGCTLDNSCDLRSIVNVTVYDINEDILASQLIYQNNLQDKFDYLFYGHLNGSSTSDGLLNKIVVAYDSPVIAGTKDPWFVIDKVTTNIVSLDTYYGTNSTHKNSTRRSSNVSTISINGLFEYSLSNFSNFDETLVKNTTNTFVGNSSINYLSGKLSSDANVTNIVRNGSDLILSGQFNIEGSDNKNLTSNMFTLQIDGYNSKLNETGISTEIKKRADDSTTQDIFGIRFNKLVSTVVEFEDNIVFIGDFVGKPIAGGTVNQLSSSSPKNSTSISNFAMYANNSWFSFGNQFIDTQFTSMVNVTINDVQYLVFQSPTLNQVWDFTNQQWVTDSVKYNLNDVSAALSLSSKQQILGSSSTFNVMDLYNVDQATISTNSNNSLTAFAFNVSTSDGASNITQSLYVNSSLSVLGGEFTTSDGIENVLLLKGNSTSSLGGKIDWGSTTVDALYAGSDTPFLFIGTNGSISVDGHEHSAGVVIYNLNDTAFNNTLQPAELSSGSNGSLSISALAVHDSDSKLIVGGNFNKAGSLDCPGFCIYDMLNIRWVQPTNNNSIADGSVVNDISFVSSDEVLITGNISFDGSLVSFITYDFVSQNFSPVSKSVGNLTAVEDVILVDNNGKVGGRMIAYGENFVSGYDGDSWSNIDQGINYTAAHTFTDMKLLQLSKSNSTNNNKKYFDQNQVLLLTGAFALNDQGLVNAAIFDGKNWIPYAFTTSADGKSLGVINSILIKDSFGFLSSESLSKGSGHMSKGKVVGISLACAIGSTILLSLLYLIPYFALFRKNKSETASNQRIHESDMLGAVNPEDLIHEIDMQKR